jgi:hypothetical protein
MERLRIAEDRLKLEIDIIEPSDPFKALEIREKELACREINAEMIASQRLEADAMREEKCCRALMLLCCEQSGLEFAQIPEEEYQSLLSFEHHNKLARYFAAGLLAQHLGIGADRAEHLLELPPSELPLYLESMTRLAGDVLLSLHELSSGVLVNGSD